MEQIACPGEPAHDWSRTIGPERPVPNDRSRTTGPERLVPNGWSRTTGPERLVPNDWSRTMMAFGTSRCG
jgi:hypothetical protein